MEETIFTYLDSIMHTKKRVESIDENPQIYSPYMINRWASMYNGISALIVNETTNRLWSALSEKKDHYEFLLHVMPSIKKQFPKYIKKEKKDKIKNAKDNIDSDALLAQRLEISKREVKLYKELMHLNTVDEI